MELCCPLCGDTLEIQKNCCKCPGGHSFDIARQGYINLLTVQHKHSLNPGGFYAPIVEALCRLAADHSCSGPVMDVGCGEGYYSTRLAKALDAELVGLDISKEAVRYAAGRHKDARWLCATASRLPVRDGSVGLLTSLFALTMPEEFHRVLRSDGAFIQVLAAEDHLLGLKSVIYSQLLHKEKNSVPEVPGFRLVESIPVRFTFTLEGQQVQDLLAMTPHYYRISKEGAARLAATERLTDTASCVLNLYQPV